MKIYIVSYGGPRGIRTPEGRTSGFTVHPIWPLWYRPMFAMLKIKDKKEEIRKVEFFLNPHFFSFLFYFFS